jgi:ubiquinone/menaquinone biosynthesis C-methylase UbiE
MARSLHILLEQSPKGRMLELGASGVMTLALKELLPDINLEVTNFDTSKSLQHVFEYTSGSYSGDFTAYSVDLESESIPVPSGYFDWVLCCEVIEHMDVDPMFMLSEVNRVLKDGGSLFLTTPNITSSRCLTKMMMGIEPYFYMQYHKDRSPYRHNYEYSIFSIKSVLKAAGFEGSIWTEDCFEDPAMKVIDKLKIAGFEIPHVGDNIITIAKKTGPVVNRYPEAIYVDD